MNPWNFFLMYIQLISLPSYQLLFDTNERFSIKSSLTIFKEPLNHINEVNLLKPLIYIHIRHFIKWLKLNVSLIINVLNILSLIWYFRIDFQNFEAKLLFIENINFELIFSLLHNVDLLMSLYWSFIFAFLVCILTFDLYTAFHFFISKK